MSRKRAENSHAAWGPEEDGLLVDLATSMTIPQLAKHFGRSPHSVKARLKRITEWLEGGPEPSYSRYERQQKLAKEAERRAQRRKEQMAQQNQPTQNADKLVLDDKNATVLRLLTKCLEEGIRIEVPDLGLVINSNGKH